MSPAEIILCSSLGLLSFFYFSYYALMSYYARTSCNIRKQTYVPKVSLIIPTFNEYHTILQKLQNIKQLEYPKDKLEVIVVDSASTDGTTDLVRHFMRANSDLELHLVEQDNRMGKAEAINFALPHCNGEIVVLSDSDSILEKNSITQIASNFSDPAVGAACGRQILLNPNQSPTTKIERTYRAFYETLRLGESHMDSTPIFHGELTAFRRGLVDRINPRSVADDSELSMYIRRKGYRAIYDPNAKFYEYAPPTLRARIKQKQRRGQGLIQQFIHNAGMIFNGRYGKYGSIILPYEFFMHIISPILLIASVVTVIIVAIDNPIFVALLGLAFLALFSATTIVLSLLSRRKNLHISFKSSPWNLVSTFLVSQICLVLGLSSLLIGKTEYKWGKIEEIRALWKKNNECNN